MLIVGAGPTGLVLALALARAGVRARIIDAGPGINGESRALDVQARTLELYRQLAVVDDVVDGGVRIERVGVRAGGRRVASVDVRGFGGASSPYPFLLCCPQDDHEAVLVRALAAAGVAVEWQTELVSVRDTDERVLVTVRGPDGAVRESSAGYVCGCDGARSVVRRDLGVAFSGRTSEQRYFVADVSATRPETPEVLAQRAFTFCLSADDFLLVVPARRTGTSRLIGLLPTGLTAGAATFEDLRPAVERATALRVDTVNWFSTYQVSHRVADRFRVGRAFLLGDAGHLHSPLGGQGMNTGIGDAVNLAWKLAAVLHGRADGRLLDTYEPERLPFARSLVATTDRLFALVAGPGRGHRWARQVLFRRLLPGLLRWPLSRTALIERISQVRLHYRESPLSQGRAGAVRGGDRLPWVELGDGRDNFESLVTLDWQVHVYGTPRAELRGASERLGLPVHAFSWSPRARTAGLRRDACYLIRPDGYVALADRQQSGERLRETLSAFGVVPRPGCELADPAHALE